MVAANWENIYHDNLTVLAKDGQMDSATRGDFRELTGHGLHVPDACDRLVSSPLRQWNVFKAIGQWIWLMNEQPMHRKQAIHYYQNGIPLGSVEERFKVLGEYGQRIFTGDPSQVDAIVDRLMKQPSSRKAVGSIFKPEDLTAAPTGATEVPCTMSFQALVRNDALHFVVGMRSQDAWSMLPYDYFMFSMLQEYMACRLNVEVGGFTQMVGSFHYYEPNPSAAAFIEATPSRSAAPRMPVMPELDVTDDARRLSDLEKQVREAVGQHQQESKRGAPEATSAAIEDLDAHLSVDPYWQELGLCLMTYGAAEARATDSFNRLRSRLDEPYRPYADMLAVSLEEGSDA